jgi:hypothetical protein
VINEIPENHNAEPVVSATAASAARPLWIWPFLAGAGLAFGLAGLVGWWRESQTKQIAWVEAIYGDSATDGDLVDEDPCAKDRRALEVAVEAWYAQFGWVDGLTEEMVVRDGLLREPSTKHDYRADTSEVVPTPGGPCANGG